jgi:hypothetical protein
MAGSHRRAKNDPASDLFDRWMTSRKEEQEPTPEPPSEPGPAPASAASVASMASVAEPATSVSTDVEFAPNTAARTLVGWLLLLSLAGLAVSAVVAFRDPTTLTVGLAATLLVLTLALWAIRAASPTTHLSVHSGQLEVVRGGVRFVFDLAGGYTPVEVVGAPGDRSWKVLFLRRNMDPFVIDSSMVDPRAFMDMLSRYRPE